MPPDSTFNPEPPPAGTYEIFISYARTDNRPQVPGDTRGWVTALRDEILADHRRFSTEPLRIFFDTSEIADMDDWRHRILEGLRHSRILLVCLSPDYFKSEPCRWEFDEYVHRQVHHLMGHDSFAQVYFAEVPGVSEQAMATGWYELLRRTNYTDLRPWFPLGIEALRDEAVRQKIAVLGTSLWERIQRARRATGVPGNLRRLNPHFIGRRTELRQLHENLAVGAVGVVTAINGLGGQGKTELATAYAHGWADCYPAGLWVLGAEGRKEMLPLLGELCRDLGLPLSAGADETAGQRGLRALAELKRRAIEAAPRDPDQGASCLVLLDNVSEPALLAEPQLAQLPREDWLRIVVTTREGPDKFPASRRKSLAFIAVDALADADAARLIEDHQGETDGQWPAATAAADAAAAREIARELGGYTLAIEGVAIYLGLHPDIRPADYLARLRAEGLPSVDSLPANADVAAQMQHREKQLRLVLDQALARLTPPERTALDYAALLPPDSVPWPWLRALVMQDHPDALAERPGYPDAWPTLRRRLTGLRLITAGDHSEVGRLHRMVGAHLRERLGERTEKLLRRARNRVEDFALSLQEAWRHDPRTLWQVVPLQKAVGHWQDGEQDTALGHIAGVVGSIEEEIGRLDVAESFLRLCHEIMERTHAANPLSAHAARDVSVSLDQLGDFLMRRGQAGDTVKALEYFERSLKVREKLLLANPSSAQAARDVSVSLDQLGNFLVKRGQAGDAAKALGYFERSLKVSEELLAANPSSEEAERDVSVSLNQLGNFLMRRGQAGDAAKALGYFERSLKVSEELLAANPSSAEAARDVSVSLNQLADFLAKRGQVGDAARTLGYFERSLKVREKLLAADPASAEAARDVSVSLNQLGNFLMRRGQAGDAARTLGYFERSLKVREELLAANPSSAQAAQGMSLSLNQLGGFLMRQGQAGDAAKALGYFERSLKVSEELLAANPSSAQAARDMSMSLDQLGNFLTRRGQAGDAAKALGYFERSLKVSEELLAVNPLSAEAARDVSVSLNQLGDFLTARGQVGDAAKAVGYFERSLKVSEELLAANPLNTEIVRDVSVSLDRLGDFLMRRGQAGDAVKALGYFERSLKVREELLSANPSSAQAVRNVSVSLEKKGDLLSRLGRGVEAMECFQKVLPIRETLLAANPGSADVKQDLAVARYNIGDGLLSTGQAAEARPHFEQATKLFEELVQTDPNQVTRLILLTECYETLGKVHGGAAAAEGRGWFERAWRRLHDMKEQGWMLDPAGRDRHERLGKILGK